MRLSHVAARQIALVSDRQALASGDVGIRGQRHKPCPWHGAGPVDADIGLLLHAENPDGPTALALLVPLSVDDDEE